MFVKEALGHTDLSNTLIYVELKRAGLQAAQEQMQWKRPVLSELPGVFKS